MFWMQQKGQFLCEIPVQTASAMHRSLLSVFRAMQISNSTTASSLMNVVHQQQPQQFPADRQNCLIELLQFFVEALPLADGAVSEFSLTAACRQCDIVTEQLPQGTASTRLLPICLDSYRSSQQSLQGMLQQSLRPQQATCEIADCRGDSEQQIIVSEGKFAIIAFDRADSNYASKLKTPVTFDDTDGTTLALGKPVMVACHHGELMSSGHYTVSVIVDDRWVTISDESVRLDVNPFEVHADDITVIVLMRDV